MDSVDDWTRVRTADGFVGYLKTKYLKNRTEYELKPEVSLPEYTSVRLDEKVCLAWHQVFSAADNAELSWYLEGTEGLNVLSPTWFSVADNQGNLNSLADSSYVAEAHKRDYRSGRSLMILTVMWMCSLFSPQRRPEIIWSAS